MGFDNECIVNIQSLAGEYFCPVCFQLVYPNEALQSRCTHLFCKPCLTYVVSTTRACPYDGYLVADLNSKSLIESNKALAETIGKIAVHCLYQRSGCTWQGLLSECTSHCSGCAFGSSPVVCNRCGIQIVHCQVQEHTQSCPGVQPQAQQVQSDQDTSATCTTTQSGTPSSQAHVSQARPVPAPGQDANQQASGNPQSQAIAQAAGPTPEQWQQQYQQFYPQYPVYDPYQRAYQNYYPYQQQAVQPHQQHAQHVLVQPQQEVCPQPESQTHFQAQTHPQAQGQSHTQLQAHQSVQAPMATQYQNQAQVNVHQQLHPLAQPHGQMLLQTQLLQQLPQNQSVHSHPQNVALSQYQQPHIQLQPHSNPHPQPQPQPQPPANSLTQPQAQVQHHPQSHPPQPPANSLTQPQSQVQHHPQSHPQLHPPQPPITNAQPQTQPSVKTVTGHTIYPQPKAFQQTQLALQQHPMHVYPHCGLLPQHPSQMHNQFAQQPPQMRPPQSHAPMQNQQQHLMLHPHAQKPGQPVYQRSVVQPVQQPVPKKYEQQQLLPLQPPMRPQLCPPSHSYPQSQQNIVHGQQPHPSQTYVGKPIMPNLGAQSQPFQQPTGGFDGPAQVRSSQSGVTEQNSNQNYLRRTNDQVYKSSEQHFVPSGMNLKATVIERQDNYMSKKSVEKETEPPSQRTARTLVNDVVPTSGVGADSLEARTLKPEADLKSVGNKQNPMGGDEDDSGHVDTLAIKKESHEVANGSRELEIMPVVKKEASASMVEPIPVGKSIEIVADKQGAKLPKDTVDLGMLVSTEMDIGSREVSLARAPALDSSIPFVHPTHTVPLTDQGRHQQPPIIGKPSALQLPQPGKPCSSFHPEARSGGNQGRCSVSSSGRGPSHFGPPHESLELQSNAHAQVQPPHTGLCRIFQGEPQVGGETQVVGPPGSFDLHRGIMGRVPPRGREAQFGQQLPINPMEAEIFPDQKFCEFDGTLEKRPLGRPSVIDSNSTRVHGPPCLDSSSTIGFWDEKNKLPNEEHLNPFPSKPARHFERVSKRFDKAPIGIDYNSGLNDAGVGGAHSRFLPPCHFTGTSHPNDARERARSFGVDDNFGRAYTSRTHLDFLGPTVGSGQHHMEFSTPMSPRREYPDFLPRGFGGLSGFPHYRSGLDDIGGGRKSHSLGEGSRSFNIPSDPLGNSFRESRFPLSPSHLRRGELDGSGDSQGGDLMGSEIRPTQFLRDGVLGPRNLPSKFLSGQSCMGQLDGPRNLPHTLLPGESFGGSKSSHPRLGKTGLSSSYSLQGFPGDGGFSIGGMDSFEYSRKRRPASMGWCRICSVDCETVEGLDFHSQTREHQNMTMDMVLSIKKKNATKQKKSSDLSSHEEASRSRTAG